MQNSTRSLPPPRPTERLLKQYTERFGPVSMTQSMSMDPELEEKLALALESGKPIPGWTSKPSTGFSDSSAQSGRLLRD